jgi:VanZ family protein
VRSRLIAVGLALGYAGLIFFLSSQSTIPIPRGIWSYDKLLHCIEYAVLAFLIARVAVDPQRTEVWTPAGIGALLSSLYGVSDEFHQSFVPGRSSDGYDVIADVVGSLLGALLFTFHRRHGLRVRRGT